MVPMGQGKWMQIVEDVPSGTSSSPRAAARVGAGVGHAQPVVEVIDDVIPLSQLVILRYNPGSTTPAQGRSVQAEQAIYNCGADHYGAHHSALLWHSLHTNTNTILFYNTNDMM